MIYIFSQNFGLLGLKLKTLKIDYCFDTFWNVERQTDVKSIHFPWVLSSIYFTNVSKIKKKI